MVDILISIYLIGALLHVVMSMVIVNSSGFNLLGTIYMVLITLLWPVYFITFCIQRCLK